MDITQKVKQHNKNAVLKATNWNIEDDGMSDIYWEQIGRASCRERV